MQIELTVAYVQFGGNTGGGKYFYSYSPDIIKVTDPNVTLEFVLSKATDPRFEVVGLVSTDANNQFKVPQIKSSKRAVDVLDANTHSQLTMVSVVVADNDVKGVHISCDPQVLNVPEL